MQCFASCSLTQEFYVWFISPKQQSLMVMITPLPETVVIFWWSCMWSHSWNNCNYSSFSKMMVSPPPYNEEEMCGHFLWNIFCQTDWPGWTNLLASTLTWCHVLGFPLVGYVVDHVYAIYVCAVATPHARVIEAYRSTAKGMLTTHGHNWNIGFMLSGY
jgi:hypothetical protein